MSPDSNLKIKCFVDLLRTFYLPPSERLPPQNNGKKAWNLHTASQLDKTGVKFKVSSSRCLFDLKFKNGVLKIPYLKLYNKT
jgi:hypothetical protein